MATRFIEGGMDCDSTDYWDKVPFCVEDDGGLALRRGSRWKGVASSDPGVERIAVQRFVPITTTTASLSVADSGATIVANTSASVTVTLPATQKGLRYTLVVGIVTSSGGHAFSPQATDKIMGNGFTSADDKDAICSTATDREGDSITLVGDGVDGWYVTSVTGTWARE